MIKLLLAASIVSALLVPAAWQQRGNSNVLGKRGDKGKATANRPPVVNSFKASHSRATIPCPGWDDPTSVRCTPNVDYTVTFTTDAHDPDGDTLLYKYSVRGGKISGEGASMVWDYTGLPLGSYVIKVEVDDQRGHVRSRVAKVELLTCDCTPPCPWPKLSLPEFISEGQPSVISAEVLGFHRNTDLRPKWSISEGTIVSGQGTFSMTVNAEGLAGKKIKVTLEVDGLPPECPRDASAEIEVRK